MKLSRATIIELLVKIFDKQSSGGGGSIWGAITGTLSNQTDLSDALALKQTAAQVQALIDAAVAGKFGTASVVVSGGTTVTLSHGFGLLGSGMSAAYSTGAFTFTKATPFTPTGDARDYAVTVTLAETTGKFTLVEKTSDLEFIVRVFDGDGSTAFDPVNQFALSIQSIAPPP